MGTGCTCSREEDTVGADTRIRHLRIENFEYDQYDFKFIGEGFKKTRAWETQATKSQIKAKREEFWNTRVEGQPEVWQTLRCAVEEPDPATAEAIMSAIGVKIVNNMITQ